MNIFFFVQTMHNEDELLDHHLKTILLKGVRDDCIDMLNMLGKGGISKESYDEIVILCKRCSRGDARNISNSKDNTYS